MIYWVLNLLFLIGVIYAAFRYITTDLSSWIFVSSLALRIMASIAAGLIFLEVYPSSDSISFYEMAQALLKQHTLWDILAGKVAVPSVNPRVFFFVKVLSVFVFLAGGSYWVAGLYFSVISFLSSWYFVCEFRKLFPSLGSVVTICFLFIPSIIFWSSAILKDTIAFTTLLMVICSVLKISKGKPLSAVEILLSSISIFVLFHLKHYLLITALLFAGLTFSIMVFTKLKSPLKWILSILIPVVFFLATQFIHPYLKVNRIAQTIYENNKTILEKTENGSHLGITIKNNEWISIVQQIPAAVYTGLFKPTFFDPTPNLGLLHKFENTLLLSLLMFSLLIILKKRPSFSWKELVPGIVCILMLATLLALTTPNLGSLVRYKNAFMPFLFLFSAILPYRYLTSE